MIDAKIYGFILAARGYLPGLADKDAATRQPDSQVTLLVEALRAIERTPNYRCCAADMRKLARNALNALKQDIKEAS